MPKGSSLASKRFCGRFHQIFTEVTSRFHEGCASFVISLVFWSRSLSFPKGFCGQFPPSLFYISLSVASTHFCIFLNCVSFWVFSHNKGLGEIDHICLLKFFAQMAFASQKVLWSVPQTVLYIRLRVSRGFSGKWLLLQKRFCEGSPNYSLHLSPKRLLLDKKFFGEFRQLRFTFISQSPPGVKVA